MCQSYDDPCDRCIGIAEEEEREYCFFCDKYDCICDELTDAYLENRIDDEFEPIQHEEPIS